MNLNISAIIFALSFSIGLSALANEKDSKRIKFAVSILNEATGKAPSSFAVKSGSAKDVLFQIALDEQRVENKSEFDAQWVGNNDSKWEADSLNWGSETHTGAFSYVKGTLESEFENIDNPSNEDKVKLVDDIQKVKKAFAILRSIKTVAYGVAPLGAVQCGVTFQALVIIDTATGEAYIISVESSGC